MRAALLVTAALLLPAIAGPSLSARAASEAPPIMGTTVLSGAGAAAIRLVMPAGGELVSMSVDSTAANVLVILSGPGWNVYFRTADITFAPDFAFLPMGEGEYHVYAVNDPPGQFVVTLRSTLAGDLALQMDRPASGAIRAPYDVDLLAGAGKPLLAKLRAERDDARPAFVGTYVADIGRPLPVDGPGTLEEFRYSLPQGPFACWPTPGGFIVGSTVPPEVKRVLRGQGQLSRFELLAYALAPAGTVTADYFRYSAHATTSRIDVLHFWMERAPDDPPWRTPEVHHPLLGVPEADYDAACVRAQLSL
jgi:hypothetical protein